MKITISLLAILLLFTVTCYAQSGYSVKGSVVDTTEKKQLQNATIMVLSAKDSILKKFTRAKEDGSFTIDGLPLGAYLMVLSYPGYADYTDTFLLNEQKKTYDVGKVAMDLKSKLLHDVIIKGEAIAIKIKGDTTEFNAKAYVIQPNDKVEDLIRQFPGIEIDKDGKITAQGQKVGKVLVDGEEFFGDDPTLVTKNIRADMVDKVQLYDKKSDQATFTGIDDGVKTKTLNIKLKDGKKNGYFGKVDAGIGTDNHYQGQLLYNKFKAKEKFSLYGIGANTGKTGLGWDDSQKFGDGNNTQLGDNGEIYFTGSGNDLSYNNRGIPKAQTGGVHYDNKWQSDKQSINGNYKIGYLAIDGVANNLTINNVKTDRIITTNSDQKFDNSIFRQKLDATYQLTLDTSSNLKITFDGTFKNNKTNNSYLDVSRRGDGVLDTLLNNSNRSNINDNNQHLFNTSAFYTKKLKKKGRTLSVLLSEAINNNDSKGYVKSETDFYNPDGTLNASKTLIVDQYKTGLTKSSSFNSNITYTEPISKYLSLIFNYGVNVNYNTSDQRSFNKPLGGTDFTILDTAYSNNLKFTQLSNHAGAVLNYTRGKNVLNFGTKAADVAYQQTDAHTGIPFKRNFINWTPQLSYQYKISQQQSIRINYNGRTTQPSINQLQPIKNNDNPLYVTLGNSNLKPSFTNSFNAGYNSYKVLSGQNIYINGNYSFSSNQIVNNTVTDNTGKTISQYFNLGGQTPYNFNFYGGVGRKIMGPDIQVGLNVNAGGGVSYSMTNNVLNTNNTANYSFGLNINKYVEKKYNFYTSFGPRFIVNESSLNKNNNSNGRGFYSYGGFNYYLPAKFQINSDMNYTFTGKTPAFNQDVYQTIVNATLSKTFFKGDNLKFSAAVNDLFNQNNGFSRYSNGNMINQSTYTTIKRYFMFSVSWDFTKMGGPAPEKK